MNYPDSKNKKVKDLAEEKVQAKKAKLIQYLRRIENSQKEGNLIDQILYKYEELEEEVENVIFSDGDPFFLKI